MNNPKTIKDPEKREMYMAGEQKTLKEIIEMVEGMKRENEKFGKCQHCRFHQGDIGHDDVCGSWNKALTELKEQLEDKLQND